MVRSRRSWGHMSDYEIRLFKADGTLSIVMIVVAINSENAAQQAFPMLEDGIVKAEIWSGLDLVEVVVPI